ncbi:hypothetical protein J2W51_003819 [Tardiphaga robiniae]|nr:hypothetical protein [Tardiphaga robiniae]
MQVSGSPRKTTYLALLAIQVLGVIVFVWQELPAFTQILLNPRQQLSSDTHSDLVAVAVLSVMQVAYWYRLSSVPSRCSGKARF